jgi:hypothetical protein
MPFARDWVRNKSFLASFFIYDGVDEALGAASLGDDDSMVPLLISRPLGREMILDFEDCLPRNLVVLTSRLLCEFGGLDMSTFAGAGGGNSPSVYAFSCGAVKCL